MNDLALAIERSRVRLAEEQARYEALSPEQQAEYRVERKKERAETEELLKKLRGPGFVELEIPPK